VTVGLTRSGLNNVDKVMEAIFSCIAMIRDRPIPEYTFSEVLQLEELLWRFASKEGVSGFVQSLATASQQYPPSLCVAGPRRLALCVDDPSRLVTSSKARTSFDSPAQLAYTKRLASEFVDNLTVDNAMFTVLSKTFQGQTNQKEVWYGTDYRVDPIPSSTLGRWRNCVRSKELGMDFPKPNVFIPSEAGLRLKYPPQPTSIKDERTLTFEERMAGIPPPAIIRDDGDGGRWTVYYKPDHKFGQPKAFVIFQLLTKEVYSSARSAALSNMYEFCVADKLAEYAYDAGLAGLTYDVRVVPRGVRLTFGGYNDKLQKFATYVSKKISADMKDILPKDEAEFDRYKDILVRTLAAFDFKQPYAHCSYYSNLMVQPPAFQYTDQDLREATEKATLEDLVSYVNSVWSSGKGLALVQGNIDESEAQSWVSTIDKALRFRPISATDFPVELAPLPLPKVPAKSMPTRLVISEPNPENGNAASYVAIQSLSEDPKEHVMMELVSAIASEPFYEDLRTRQQLGYVVSTGVKAVGKTKTLGFIVQSSTASTDKLTTEILKYMDNIRPKLLEKLSRADLEVYVKSLIDRKTEPDKQLSTEVTRNWAEIGSGRLEFDRPQREVAALLDVTKTDLLDFWDRFYLKDGRRVLITEMIPQVGAASTSAPPKSTGYSTVQAAPTISAGLVLGIDDIERYRQDRQRLVSNSADSNRLA
jgi:insulysin